MKKRILFISLLSLFIIILCLFVSFKINNLLLMVIANILCFSIYLFCFLRYQKKCHQKCEELSLYMNKVLNGNYSFDIRDYCEGPFSILKSDIYKLTVKLKEQTEIAISEKNNLETILSDISHQIKTPLTSMHIINDLLMNSKLSKKEEKQFLKKNELQLEKIEWLVISLLKLSRLDNGFIKLERKEVNSHVLIDKALENILIPVELKKQTLKKDIANFSLNVDLNWTVEALLNILKNAHEHAPIGGMIKITAGDNPLYSFIKIENNGPNISSKDIPYIFERFYKGDNQKDSIGIGLNLAKKIIDLEGGNISIKSEKDKWTCFEIRFHKSII